MRTTPHTTLVLLLGLACTSGAHASEWAVGGGYLGETIAHPGVVGTIERRVSQDDKHTLLIAADLGGYWHPRFQWAPHVDVRAGYRHAFGRHYSADLSVGVGYLRSYIAAETVNFDNSGRGQLFVPVDVGFVGWELSPDSDHSLRLASSVRLMWQSPVNDHAVMRPALTCTLTRAL